MYPRRRFSNYLSDTDSDISDVSLLPAPGEGVTSSNLTTNTYGYTGSYPESEIFEMDEYLTSRNKPNDDHGSSSTQFQERLPMGRLRNAASTVPHRNSEKIKFPAMYVEGFRNGHVAIDIPGVLADSFEPADSIDLRFTYYNEDEHRQKQEEQQQEERKQKDQNQLQPSCSTNRFSFSDFSNSHEDPTKRLDSGCDGFCSFSTKRTEKTRGNMSFDSGIPHFTEASYSIEYSPFSQNIRKFIYFNWKF